MEASPKPPGDASPAAAGRIDWGLVSTWLLGFGLVLYLGLKGGGFDPLIHDQVGIAAWWVLLATVAIGALPRRRPATLAWVALGLLAAFVVWTALSLTWTESTEKTAEELALVAGYLGVFALAVFNRRPRGARWMVAAVGSAIAVVGIVALLSRLHPAWFPSANQTAQLLDFGKERLSYPLNYWNALATLIAIGLPLLLQMATGARQIAFRALAAAAMPALMLAAFFTFSRGGIAAVFLGLGVFLALTSDRLPKLLTLLVAGGGGAILVAGAVARHDLRYNLDNATAHHQGNELLVWTIVVCLIVGLVQAGISVGLERDMRPSWTRVSRRHSLIALGVVVLVGLVVAIAAGGPGKLSNAWDNFKQPEVGAGTNTDRLSSSSGESRYQFWSSAWREFEDKPLTGTGSGTFELWWTRDGDTPDIVNNAHSLYLETLGELGFVGAALLIGFLLTVLIGGALAAVRAGELRAPPLSAAVAGFVAFCFTGIFDWMWQVPVVPVAALLLAAAVVTHAVGSRSGRSVRGPAPFPPLARVGVVAGSLVVVVAIAIALASTALLRQSQDEAQVNDFSAALEDARSAQNVLPDAAGPRLQEALILETEGELAPAAEAARAAIDREPNNWRLWMVLSRIEAQLGDADAAVRSYEKARSLNPESPLFAQYR
jgi:O-antigen ligase